MCGYIFALLDDYLLRALKASFEIFFFAWTLEWCYLSLWKSISTFDVKCFEAKHQNMARRQNHDNIDINKFKGLKVSWPDFL